MQKYFLPGIAGGFPQQHEVAKQGKNLPPFRMRVVNTWFLRLYFGTVTLSKVSFCLYFLCMLVLMLWGQGVLHFRTYSSMAYNLIFFCSVDWFGDLHAQLLVSELSMEKRIFRKGFFPWNMFGPHNMHYFFTSCQGQSHKIIQRLQGNPMASSVTSDFVFVFACFLFN